MGRPSSTAPHLSRQLAASSLLDWKELFLHIEGLAKEASSVPSLACVCPRGHRVVWRVLWGQGAGAAGSLNARLILCILVQL